MYLIKGDLTGEIVVREEIVALSEWLRYRITSRSLINGDDRQGVWPVHLSHMLFIPAYST